MNGQAPKLTREEQKEKAQKVYEASEIIRKLVVKIISWRTGLLEGATIKDSNKITISEWTRYKKHLLEISKTDSVEKVKLKLQETYESIKNRGGFE